MTSPLSHSHTRSASLSCGTLPQQDACALQRSDFLSSAPPHPHAHTHTDTHTCIFSHPTALLSSPLLSAVPALSSLCSFRSGSQPELQPEPQSGTPLRLPLRRGEDEREEGREKDQRRRNERPDKVTEPMCRIRQEACRGGGNEKLCCQEITTRQV